MAIIHNDSKDVDYKPLVSFILGVYNTHNFSELDVSISTMLGQTYKNVELVICDDMSTNGLFEYICNKYGQLQNVTILRNEINSGLRVSLNKCLEYAKGEFIARQDDDDYSDLSRIEKQMNILLAKPTIDFVSTGLIRFDKEGYWGKLINKERPHKIDFAKHSQFVHAATLFRKSCLKAVNGYRVSEETVRGEDYDLFMRLYAKGFKGYNIQEVLYYYNKSRKEEPRLIFKYCINEFIIRVKGYRLLKLPVYCYLYSLRPIVAFFIPRRIVNLFK